MKVVVTPRTGTYRTSNVPRHHTRVVMLRLAACGYHDPLTFKKTGACISPPTSGVSGGLEKDVGRPCQGS